MLIAREIEVNEVDETSNEIAELKDRVQKISEKTNNIEQLLSTLNTNFNAYMAKPKAWL